MPVKPGTLEEIADAVQRNLPEAVKGLSESFVKRMMAGEFTESDLSKTLLAAVRAEARQRFKCNEHEAANIAAYWAAGGGHRQAAGAMWDALRIDPITGKCLW